MLLKGNLPPELYSYGNMLSINYISYIFEFQLVLFAFSFILVDPFMVSPCPNPHRAKERGTFFQKNPFFHGGGGNFVDQMTR